MKKKITNAADPVVQFSSNVNRTSLIRNVVNIFRTFKIHWIFTKVYDYEQFLLSNEIIDDHFKLELIECVLTSLSGNVSNLNGKLLLI